MKKILILFLLIPLLGQDTFTENEVVKILEDRDEQWKEKIAKANTLVEFQKITISDCEAVVSRLEEQSNVDSLLLVAKQKQINLLKARDEMNKKMVKLIEPKWYENKYIMVAFGFLLGIL